jgi:hypothetical protein
MQALAVTARRGAVLMAAGAIARIVAKQIGTRLLSAGTLPARTSSAPAPPTGDSLQVIEEVVYFRRRLYRRG